MERAGLLDLADTPIGTLSGGQRQRAFIAMALAQDTEILFLDEPTTFLDVRYQTEILRLIRELNEKHGVTVVMVLHDINQAIIYSDEIIGLADGKALVHGPPGEVISSESIERLYGVRLDVREDAESGRKWVLPETRESTGPAQAFAKETWIPGQARNDGGEGQARNDEAPEESGNENKGSKANIMRKIIKPFFIALGFISLGLGALGVVLPVLPTTPFLLLTAFCFARGSERFHRWFVGTKLYKTHLDDFVKTKSMPARTKAYILTAVSILLPVAMYFVPYPHARILMGVVLAWHWWYFLFRVKTLPRTSDGKPASGGGMIDKRLLRFAAGARKYVFLSVLARWVGLLLGAFVVFAVSDIAAVRVPALLLGVDMPVLPVLGVCAVAAGARALCEFFASKAAFRAQTGVKKKLRTELYAKLLALGGSGASGAETVQVAVEGVDRVENYFGRYLPQFFYSMIAPLTLFALLAPVSLSVALILLVCTPLIPLLILLIMRMAKKMMRKQLKSYTSLGDFFLESLRGMTTLKIYGADERRHEEMNGLSESFRKSTMRVLRMQLNSVMPMDLIAQGGTALGIILAARGLLAGDIGAAGAISVVLLSAEFFIPLRQLGSYFHVAMDGLAACERVFQIMDAEEPADGKSSLPEGPLSVELRGLSFAYEEGRNVLSDVSFSAAKRGFTGLAGASGCGKSTVAKLLSGRIPAAGCEGDARIGGVGLSDIKRSELMKRVYVVTHEDYIFTGTARDNLRAARPGASEDELEAALKDVRLYDFFAGAEGLETKISEGGANLSGGQRQRLSLARALLRDPDLYIFDEATSNMDTESEEALLAVVKELATKKNVIFISHRLANLTGADMIYAMDAGRVAEAGTHEELTARGGVYARLYSEQQALETYAAGGPAAYAV
jgi:ABC-type transport system involved in cytochrome bd biosynthesis fused ATPase/permease subunit/uncharacterized membrane protein YbaN (DUF454 family)